MWKDNPLVNHLTRSCDLEGSPEVGKWYAVPTYPLHIEFHVNYRRLDNHHKIGSSKSVLHHLPVLLPAHEDEKAFGFARWHYHVDLRFVHSNELKFIVNKMFGIEKRYLNKFIHIPAENQMYNDADWITGNTKVIAAWELGVTDPKIISASWYKFLADRFFLIVTNNGSLAAPSLYGKDADFNQVKWKAQMCHFTEQEPYNPRLHNILSSLPIYQKVKRYCGRCPHKGVNLDSVPIDENGVKVCPAHGARWKISNNTIQICEKIST